MTFYLGQECDLLTSNSAQRIIPDGSSLGKLNCPPLKKKKQTIKNGQ